MLACCCGEAFVETQDSPSDSVAKQSGGTGNFVAAKEGPENLTIARQDVSPKGALEVSTDASIEAAPVEHVPNVEKSTVEVHDVDSALTKSAVAPKVNAAGKEERKPLNMPPRNRARRTSVPLDVEPEDGAFLMYDAENDVIYAHWSHTPVTNALAWMKPLVRVPEHKYKRNEGRYNIFTSCKEDNKYYRGWINFIKISLEYPSKFMLFDNFDQSNAIDVQILQLVDAVDKTPSGVTQITPVVEPYGTYNKLVDLKNVKAIAVVPLTSTLIPTSGHVEPQKFLQMGEGEGSSTLLYAKQ